MTKVTVYIGRALDVALVLTQVALAIAIAIHISGYAEITGMTHEGLVRTIAYLVYLLFSAASWYLWHVTKLPGLHAWCRGWSLWAIHAGMGALGSREAVSPGILSHALSLANSGCFGWAAIELGWGGASSRLRRSWILVVVMAGVLICVAQIRDWGALSMGLVDAVVCVVAATVLGLALRRRLQELRFARRRAYRFLHVTVTGAALMVIFVAFGALQFYLTFRAGEEAPSAILWIVRAGAPAVVGLALLAVLNAVAYRTMEERLDGAEFVIDANLMIRAASRTAAELVGRPVSEMLRRSIGEVLFRYLEDLDDLGRELESHGEFGPTTIICKQASGASMDIRCIRRSVAARRAPGRGPDYAIVVVGLAQVPEESGR